MENKQIIEVMEKLSNDEYRKLSVSAKFLYLSLICEIEKLNTYYLELSNLKVRNLLNVSNKTAVKIIKELEEFSLIRKFKQNKNTNFIKLVNIAKEKRNIRLIKFENKLYTYNHRKSYNYDWLKTSYERFGM